MKAVVVNPLGANVINQITGKPTGEILPVGTQGDTGLQFEGTWDGDGKPIGEQFRRIEFYPNGQDAEVWVNTDDLAPAEEAIVG